MRLLQRTPHAGTLRGGSSGGGGGSRLAVVVVMMVRACTRAIAVRFRKRESDKPRGGAHDTTRRKRKATATVNLSWPWHFLLFKFNVIRHDVLRVRPPCDGPECAHDEPVDGVVVGDPTVLIALGVGRVAVRVAECLKYGNHRL